jgi:hypothetical protein
MSRLFNKPASGYFKEVNLINLDKCHQGSIQCFNFDCLEVGFMDFCDVNEVVQYLILSCNVLSMKHNFCSSWNLSTKED